jgi:hypothetical protein
MPAMRRYNDRFVFDVAGVVHVVGLHTDTRVMTECGRLVIRAERPNQTYETTDHHPNCLECVNEWLIT